MWPSARANWPTSSRRAAAGPNALPASSAAGASASSDATFSATRVSWRSGREMRIINRYADATAARNTSAISSTCQRISFQTTALMWLCSMPTWT